MTDGLKDEHREAIIAAIAANNRVERAVLFGSRATGTNTVSSDVDIALFGDGLRLTDQARLAAVLDEIPMAQSVDLLLYDSTLDRTLREQIRRQGVEFYVRSSPHSTGRRSAATSIGTAVLPNGAETVSGWRRRDVGEMIQDGSLTVGDGYRAKNSELAVSGLPFARAGNIADGFRFSDADRFPKDRLHRAGDKTSRPGDVVFTSKGTVGRFAFVRRDTEHFVYSPQLCFWRSLDREVIDPYFLYCWVRGPEFFGQFRGVAGQTDMAEYVSLTDQRRMFITLPSVAEQRAIAHIVGTLDDKIELHRRMSATLEAMARALFKSWFVNFDPVRAKMEGRDTGLPKEIADLFPDRMVDSELGEIPEGWAASELGDMIELAYGKALKAQVRKAAGGVPVFGSNGQIGWHNEALVQGPGIVVGRKGNPGTVTLSLTEFFPIDTTFYVAPKHEYGECLYFLFFALQQQDLPSVAADSAVPGLNRNLAYMNKQLKPPTSVVECFDGYVSVMYARRLQAAAESRVLISLRDSLLPKLVSGELRVSGFGSTSVRDERPAAVGSSRT